jgi:predicted hydrocarbon binding protein
MLRDAAQAGRYGSRAVHGVIFTSLRDYVAAVHGPKAVAAVFAGEQPYLLGEAYPDERLHVLLDRVGEVTGTDADETLRAFGAYTVQHAFARLYPAFFAVAPSAREFLLTVETRIHELVRATIPRAEPPRLVVEEDGADGVRIEYRSRRHLCVFLCGLVEGTAQHYHEVASIEETACMRRGDEACTFAISLSPS